MPDLASQGFLPLLEMVSSNGTCWGNVHSLFSQFYTTSQNGSDSLGPLAERSRGPPGGLPGPAFSHHQEMVLGQCRDVPDPGNSPHSKTLASVPADMTSQEVPD